MGIGKSSRIVLLLFNVVCFYVGRAQECGNVNFGNVGDLDTDIFIDSNGNSYVYENNNEGFHYFAKYNADGAQVFLKTLNISGNYFLADVTGNDQSVYILTSFCHYQSEGELIATDGTSGLILKYDLDGNLLWQKVFKSDVRDGFAHLTSGAVDQNGDLYVGVTASEEIEVNDAFFGEVSIWASIFKFDESGNSIWSEESVGRGRINEMEITTGGNLVAAVWSTADYFTFRQRNHHVRWGRTENGP